MKEERLLAIDPGLNCFGLALFEGEKLIRWGHVNLKREDWLNRLDRVVLICRRLSRLYCVQRVVVELPHNFGNAASSGDSILKLYGLVMVLRYVFLNAGISVGLVPVREWKGTLPKKVTQERVRRRYNWAGKNSDEADAIGIGDYWIRNKSNGRCRDRDRDACRAAV